MQGNGLRKSKLKRGCLYLQPLFLHGHPELVSGSHEMLKQVQHDYPVYNI